MKGKIEVVKKIALSEHWITNQEGFEHGQAGTLIHADRLAMIQSSLSLHCAVKLFLYGTMTFAADDGIPSFISDSHGWIMMWNWEQTYNSTQ